MSLFECSSCGCVEDTFLCHYWSARLRQTEAICSACDPKVGKWHGEFPRESAEGWIRDRRGFLICHKGEVEQWLGRSVEIIGQAPSIQATLIQPSAGEATLAADASAVRHSEAA
jgi:hypothetical protein